MPDPLLGRAVARALAAMSTAAEAEAEFVAKYGPVVDGTFGVPPSWVHVGLYRHDDGTENYGYALVLPGGDDRPMLVNIISGFATAEAAEGSFGALVGRDMAAKPVAARAAARS